MQGIAEQYCMALSNVITFSIKFDDNIFANFNTNGAKITRDNHF